METITDWRPLNAIEKSKRKRRATYTIEKRHKETGTVEETYYIRVRRNENRNKRQTVDERNEMNERTIRGRRRGTSIQRKKTLSAAALAS